MRKALKTAGICLCIVSIVWSIMLISDRQRLNRELIRLHVVANSDSEEDQSVKLQVRDAVLGSVQEDLKGITDVQEAKRYLQENLTKIQNIANKTLSEAGFDEKATVTLCKETFDIRHYDTFSLPAGVYEALRITIGEGNGKNWWCVAFPSLCMGATSRDFEAAAAGAGFPERLCGTLEGEKAYEIRFFLLDAIGKLENMWFEG